MPLDPRVKRFLDALAASEPRNPRDLGVARRRAQLRELMQLGADPEAAVRSEDCALPGPSVQLAACLYSPGSGPGLAASAADPAAAARNSAALLPGLVYFHGGGLLAGSIATHASIARALCSASGCRVLAVEYRLAPENPFPAGLEDAIAALDYVAAHAAEFGIDAAKLGVCGDSAGGTLTAAACGARARAGSARLALQVLICPILDHAKRDGSRREFASGYLIDQGTLAHDLEHYAPGGADPLDPRISPLRAEDFSGLPPTLVHTAEYDPLRDEGREYFERLIPGGSALAYTCHTGMIHLFYGLGSVIPYARTALQTIGAEIRAALIDPGALA